MTRPAASAVLLDIEGTTSSVSFVYEVLFPYARAHLDAYLRAHWATPECDRARELVARDLGARSFEDWAAGFTPSQAREQFAAAVLRQMDTDAKATGLKDLQGLIWRDGFLSGQLRSHVYPDVPPALRSWHARGLDVRIYSSGSIAAQRLFFAHTDEGDLTGYFRGHYDTTTGPKRAAESYRKIAADAGWQPETVVFLSDVVEELDAAREAGMRTGLSVRPGNAPARADHGHPVLHSFAEADI